ncbi:MAG: sugar ABC transporter permease, partial [Actinomycetota bacterium]|nr:sugar ABC transporter permease [Actinomycetota bacterium]
MATVASDRERSTVPRRRRRVRRRQLTVLLFMSPWIIGFLAFNLYPALATLYYSFTKYDLVSPPQWVGLFNYRFMFTSDPDFWLAMRNTLWIMGISIPLQVVFAIACAVVLTRPRRGVGVYRTIYFVPTMIPAVAATLGFVFLLNPKGPIDAIL